MKIVSVRELAACVSQARKKRGWTQAQLAEKSGVSRAWIIELEKAKPTLELSLVLRTLKALHIPLFIGEQPPRDANFDDIDLNDILNNQGRTTHS